MLAFIQRGNKATKAGEFGVDGKTSDNYFETATDCPMIKSSCRHVSEKAYGAARYRAEICVSGKNSRKYLLNGANVGQILVPRNVQC